MVKPTKQDLAKSVRNCLYAVMQQYNIVFGWEQTVKELLHMVEQLKLINYES